MLKEHLSMPIMTACIIDNFQQLITIASDEQQLKDIKSVTFSDNFDKELNFALKIEGKTANGEPLMGHITTDLLSICNGLQDFIYQSYAMIIKEKYDARSLTQEEKEKLTLIFQIQEGSSLLKTAIDNFKHLKDMETSKIITLTCGICFCFGGYFLYQNNQNNNKTKEFLALNENIKIAIEGYKDITIRALHSSKLDIEKIKFGQNEEITKQQIQEMYKDITENEENIEPNQANYNFIVKKLYKKGNGTKKKNMATLYNDKIEIETEIVANLFENNENLFFTSYKNDTFVNCDIIEYKTNGKITKAILTKINQINN